MSNPLSTYCGHNFIKTPLLYKRVAQLNILALFIHGEFDVRPVWPVEQLVNLLPDARLKILEAEHHLWLMQPDNLRRLLRGFIRRFPS